MGITQFRRKEKNLASLASEAFTLERQGRFGEALSLFSEDWQSTEPEDLAGRLDFEYLEARLRFAVSLGYEGHPRVPEIPDAQLRARDILTSVREQFLAESRFEKAAECENNIALTYSRTGEFPEALVWLETAWDHNLPPSEPSRLNSVMIQMIIEIGLQRYAENIKLFSEHELAIRDHGDGFIKGSCYLNVGISYLECGRPHDALRCIELSKYYYESGGVERYLGGVENELAHVYLALCKYTQAHLAVDRGIHLFEKTGDRTREGFLFDTKASIFLAEGELAQAKVASNRSIRTLRDTENKGFLSEALLTRAKIAFIDEGIADAEPWLEEVEAVAELVSGKDFAQDLLEQFATFRRSQVPGVTSNPSELSLVFPMDFPQYANVTAVRIASSHLACVGMNDGDLAVAAPLEIKRGDLVATRLMPSGEVICGFYDKEFGIICLKDCDGSPRIFDDAEIVIIGKVVGVCSAEKIKKGVAEVSPLRPRSTEV